MVLRINDNAERKLNGGREVLRKSVARLKAGCGFFAPARPVFRTGTSDTPLGREKSFLQTQDGALNHAGKVLERVADLKGRPTAFAESRRDEVEAEFSRLKSELRSAVTSQLDGVALFGEGPLTASSNDASRFPMELTRPDLAGAAGEVIAASTPAGLKTEVVASAITAVAGFRAQNAAEARRLDFAAKIQATMQTNLEAARGFHNAIVSQR